MDFFSSTLPYSVTVPDGRTHFDQNYILILKFPLSESKFADCGISFLFEYSRSFCQIFFIFISHFLTMNYIDFTCKVSAFDFEFFGFQMLRS